MNTLSKAQSSKGLLQAKTISGKKCFSLFIKQNQGCSTRKSQVRRKNKCWESWIQNIKISLSGRILTLGICTDHTSLQFILFGGEGKCFFHAIILSPRLKSECRSMITCRGWISARNNSGQSCRHWLNRNDDVKLNQIHVDHRLPIPSLPALQYLQHPPAVSVLYQAHLLSPLKCQLQ